MEADFAKKYQKTNNRLCIEIKNFNVDVHHIFFIKFQSIKTSMVTEMVLNIAVVYFILYWAGAQFNHTFIQLSNKEHIINSLNEFGEF